MNKTARQLAANLLRTASSEFGNHGCNDYELENTQENRQFVAAMLAWNSDDPEEQQIHYSDDRKKIYTQDWFVMSYCAYLLEQ